MSQKPKVDRTKYIIQDKQNETIIKKTGEVDGFNFKIRNIDNCTIYLLDWTKGVKKKFFIFYFLYHLIRCSLMIAQIVK
jgi:hypothetical protein